jgi:hypothetical protein
VKLTTHLLRPTNLVSKLRLCGAILPLRHTRVYPKASRLSRNEINNNKHSLRSNTKGYGGKTHYTDSQNSDITATTGRELYHLQFSLQAASPETFGYTLVCLYGVVTKHRGSFVLLLLLLLLLLLWYRITKLSSVLYMQRDNSKLHVC